MQARLKLRGEIANLETKAAVQQERAATAEKNLLELQQRVADRRLSEGVKKELVRLLSAQPTIALNIDRKNDVPDGQIYSEDFADVFRRIGWPVNTSTGFFSGDFKGIVIVAHDEASVPQQAVVLQQALKRVGIDAPGALMQLFPWENLS